MTSIVIELESEIKELTERLFKQNEIYHSELENLERERKINQDLYNEMLSAKDEFSIENMKKGILEEERMKKQYKTEIFELVFIFIVKSIFDIKYSGTRK